jgi:photosystem II stability/assembly factor-like uncharacterized protein
VDANVAWASGSNGTVLKTRDGGKSWVRITVPETANLDFRGVQAFDGVYAALMSSGEGVASTVYRNEGDGAVWKIWYINHDAKGFFDAIALPSPKRFAVLGDPVGDTFQFITADQAGGVYTHVHMPKALAGEGAFAASNTSLVFRGKRVWFATGGPSGARVFRSDDGGENWSVSNTPVRADGEGAGIFSLAFADDNTGVAVGGSFKNPKENAHNIALTADGGATWTEPPSGTPPRGYRSAVAWLPQHKLWITTGPTGSELSRNGGRNWIPFDDGSFNAIGVGPDDVCYAVGAKGRIARLVFPATPGPR